MKLKHVIGLITSLLLLFMLAGCADVPQQDIDDANAALNAAKQAEADKYVPDQYNAAKKSLDNAMAMVEEEKGSMFSNYDEAIQALQAAKQAANSAAEAVPAKKEEIKGEVENLLAQIPEVVKQTKTAWKKAPRGKGTREPLQMIKQDIENTEASVSEVNAALEQGDLLGARQKAQEIISKLQRLQSELQ